MGRIGYLDMSGAIFHNEHVSAPLLGYLDRPVFRLGDRLKVAVLHESRHWTFNFQVRTNAVSMRLYEGQACHGRVTGPLRNA